MASPHRGSPMADAFVGFVGNSLTRLNPVLEHGFSRLAVENPNAMTPEAALFYKGRFSAVRTLSPGDRQIVEGESPESEGIANQTDPESWVTHREVRCEALTGEPAGQPSRSESFISVRGMATIRRYALQPITAIILRTGLRAAGKRAATDGEDLGQSARPA